MKQLVLVISLLSFASSLRAQFAGHYNALNIAGTQNTLKSEIPLAAPAVIGSTYLDEEWQSAEIVLKDGMVINEFPVRVEIEQGNVEIKYHGEVKFLNLREIDSLRITDKRSGLPFLIQRANLFKVDEVPLKGIVMVYPGADWRVVKHLYIEFLPSNYNVAMDVGSKDHRKVKKQKLYLTQGSNLIPVKGSNKKIISQLGNTRGRALEVVKANKLNLTQETDLVTFVRLLSAG